MFVMQTSAMKTCFQIAECSFSYAKLSNISVTSKYLNEINIIIGQILLNPPSCFLKRDGGFFFYTELSHAGSTRPERAEAPSPGQRPGLLQTQTCRPERAKALCFVWSFKAFALTGRLCFCHHTQGDALG